jgi:hypothetical protein
MDINLEEWIVGVFAVLPGFVSAAIRSAIAPGETSSAGEWLAGSIVTSLVFNAITFLAFVFATSLFPSLLADIHLGGHIKDIAVALGEVPGTTLLWYIAILYGWAVLWGIVSGLLSSHYAPRRLAYRLRLTPVSPHPNVFNDVLEELIGTAANRLLRGDPAQQVPWLRVQRGEMVIFGRLRTGSVDFAVDKPAEVFLSPAQLLTDAKSVSRDRTNPYANHVQGLYLRLLPKDLVEILVERADWDPFTKNSRAISVSPAADDFYYG